jgi:amidohydrolase
MKPGFTYNADFVKWLINTRRYFHQFPEVSFNEHLTQAKVIEVLNSFGIENRKIAGTGVVGMIRGTGAGKTIAIRADLDALKIQEESTDLNKQYISLNDGVMHACGHDGHIAMVLGAARKLQECKDKLKGNVKLIFQPAEEIPPGGAVEVLKMGGLVDVDAIIGVHLFTNIKLGEICLKEGALMAGHCMYNIIINGKPGHHFNPDTSIDPILIASEFIAGIQSKLKNNLPPNVNYVFGVGTIKGGEQFNQIPGSVDISGSFRMLDKNYLHVIEDTMKRNLDGLMLAHGKEGANLPNYKLEVTQGYPVLVNHKKFTHRSAETLKEILTGVNENIDYVFAAEDFARYLEAIPGTFIFLGAGNSEKGLVYGNHSSRFDIDESVLIKGVGIFFSIATDFLDAPENYL